MKQTIWIQSASRGIVFWFLFPAKIWHTNFITLPAKIVIFPEHRVRLLPHLRRIDYSYTMKSHAAPRIPNIPSKNHVCNFDFCTPVNANEIHLKCRYQNLISLSCNCQVNATLKIQLFTIWLQPPSFSIVTLHLGHSLVLAAIQFDVSESSSHFLIHFLRYLHKTGSCQFSPHSKQNTWPHLQLTGRDST